MHPTDAMECAEEQGRWHAWRVARWLITAAASLLLVTLFLTQTTGTEAAPVPTSETVISHDAAACPAGFNCAANFGTCLNGNFFFCGGNLGFINPGFGFGAGLGCVLGNLSCNVNFVNPAFVNVPFNNGCSVFVCANFVPNNVFAANGCPVGNFSCLGTFDGFFDGLPASVFVNNGCPVGNFSCLGNFPINGCAAGNFSCLRAFFGFPFSTGVFSGNATIIAPSGNPIVVGPPFRVREVEQPAAATAPAAQLAAPAAAVQTAPVASPAPVAPVVAPVAAPAAPAANYITALNAPAPVTAPAASTGGGGVHVLSAPPATAPTAARDPDDHR